MRYDTEHIRKSRDDYRGCWSVDHIMPAKDCRISIDGKSFDGYLVRLIKYKKDPEQSVGLRYMLIKRDLYPKQIDFGNTYYLPKHVTERVSATFNGLQHNTLLLTKAVEIETSIKDSLSSSIQSYFDEANSRESASFTNVNAAPLSKDDNRRIWTRIHVHHVSQGDTIVLELPDSQLWMVDARFWTRERRDLFDQWMQERFGNRGLNRLIISHFHYDHIKSVPHIIQRYTPNEVVVTDSLRHTTAATERALHCVGNRLLIARNDEVTQLGTLRIRLNTTAETANLGKSANPNDHEVSVILESENGIAFLAGDMSGGICNQLLTTSCPELSTSSVRFYKVSHHGSKTGYDKEFFQHFDPNESIISCGQNNRYGHPARPPIGSLGGETTITWAGNQHCYEYEL